MKAHKTFINNWFCLKPPCRFVLSGYELGCVSPSRYREAMRVQRSLQDAMAALQALTLSTASCREKLPDVRVSESKNAALT